MSLSPDEEKLRATGAIEYQEGGIVSRAVLKGDAGSVTIFAFEAGQELSEHTTPHDALLHVIEGEAAVRIGDREHRLAAGEMVVLPAGVPHAVTAPVRFKMILTMIRA